MVAEQEITTTIITIDGLPRKQLSPGEIVTVCLVYNPRDYCRPGQPLNGSATSLIEDPFSNGVIAGPDSIVVPVYNEGAVVRQQGDQWLVEKSLISALALVAASLDAGQRAALFEILSQKPDEPSRSALVVSLEKLGLRQFADLIGCAPVIALTRFMTSQHPG